MMEKTVLPPRVASGAPLPVDEEKRLDALYQYQILDTADEQAYDDLVHLAATVCGTPIAMVSLIDRDRQWFKSRVGIEGREDPREASFCAHAILRPGETMTVPNALEDARFAENPLVQSGTKIRFYAGVPLVTREGAAIGTICVIDKQPRTLSKEQERALRVLARQVVSLLELREAVTELEQQSLTDALTGVWNRRAFDLRLREEWTRHARSGEPLAMLMIDIDRFKLFNDTFGHPEGDRTLRRAAHVLGKMLRGSDYLVRYGGEEFSILLPNTNADGARVAAERSCHAMHVAEWPKSPVTISIGVGAAFPAVEEDRNLLIARADHALYYAKRAGGNRVESFRDWTTPQAAQLEEPSS
jgi:diguanylate cyclase (GGDEF)-like protein